MTQILILLILVYVFCLWLVDLILFMQDDAFTESVSETEVEVAGENLRTLF